MDDPTDSLSGMKVLVRLDDFTPNRNVGRWDQIEHVLDSLGIKPLVACIPNDQYFGTAATTSEFWDQVRKLQRKGWAIALHGETHLVTPIAAGASQEIFFAEKGEFVGLPEDVQSEIVARAWSAFAEQGLRPKVFVAPNHGFDANTVRAICKHGAMPFVSDGVSWRVFRDRGLVWLPQIDWRMPRVRFGFRTVCLHPSTMSKGELEGFAAAARSARRCFTSLEEIDPRAVSQRGVGDLLFEKGFALYMRVKKAFYLSSRPAGANMHSDSQSPRR